MPTQSEIIALAEAASSNRTKMVMQFACLSLLTATALANAASRAEVGDLIELGRICISTGLREMGVDEDEYHEALNALQRATETARYIASIPK